MGKTILQILGTSTPVSEHVASELGLVKAAIICRVFFYQQLKDGVCKATNKSFQDALGLSGGAVSSNLKWLLEYGWIANTEPLVKGNRPNHYKVTQKFYDLLDQNPPSANEGNSRQRSLDESDVQEMNVDVHEVNGKEELKEKPKEKESASATPSKKKPKPKSEPKPAAAHVYRKNAHLWPVKSIWPDLDKAIGDSPERLDLWGRVVKAWIMSGWNPHNIKGMLECFERDEIPGTGGGKQNGTNGKANGRQNGIHNKSERQSLSWNPKTGETFTYR